MRWHLILAAAIVGFYVYTFPFYPSLRSANEMPRILLTEEIVEHHTFSIDKRMAELGSTFDVATTPDGHHYSNKAPGQSLLAVPVYLFLHLGKPSLAVVTWAFRFVTSTIPALIFLFFFWRGTREFSEDDEARKLAFLAYAFGSMALPYAILLMPHQTAGATCGGAFIAGMALVRGPRWHTTRDALILGALAGIAIVFDYFSIFAVAAIGIYVLACSPKRWRDAGFALLGFAVPILLLLAYHKACFGSPFKTGYSFAVDPMQKKGVLGIVGPSRLAFFQVLVQPSNGILVLMPWTLFAIAGAAHAWKRRRAEVVTCAAVFVMYIVFLGVLEPEVGRGGWGVGPRYMTVAFPFAAWLACAGFELANRHRVTQVLAWTVVLLSVLIYVLITTTYPHWPTRFSNPLYEVAVRTLRENMAPPSIGTAIGLHGVASLIPAYLLIVGIIVLLARKRWVPVAIAAVVAVGIFAAYSKFPRTPNADAVWQNVRATWR